MPVPSETYEQVEFVRWLEANDYTFTAIPNNTYTPSYAAKAKNKRLGLRPGLPDLLIALKCSRIMFLEMKRTKGGRLSPAQKAWLETLGKCNVITAVCAGHQAAIEEVKAVEMLY